MTVLSLIIEEKYEEALALAKEELKRNPGDHQLLMWSADLYMLTRQTQRAVDALTQVADTAPAAKAVVALKKMDQIGSDRPTMYDSVVRRLTTEGATDVRSPLFDDFGEEELLAFIRGLQLEVHDPGDIIVGEGEQGDSLFILTSGIAKAFVRKGDGRFERARTLHDGDFFGEISILNGGKRTATITAATRCELLELDRRTLDEITVKHPRVREVMEAFRDDRLAADRSR